MGPENDDGRGGEGMSADASIACLRCGTIMTSMGIEQFRTGGTSGGWKLLFGEWAEVSEDMLPLAVSACGHCGYVELRRPEAPATST